MTENLARPYPIESTSGDRHVARHNQFEFDVYKLIQLTREVPAVDVMISEYEYELDDPCWVDSKGDRITPRVVIEIYKSQSLEQALLAHPELSKHLRNIDQPTTQML